MVEILINELSVSTAEEFLNFSSRYSDEAAQLLDVAPETVDRFAEAPAPAIDDDEVAPISTGPMSDYSDRVWWRGEMRHTPAVVTRIAYAKIRRMGNH